MRYCWHKSGNDGIESGNVRKDSHRISATAASHASLVLCAALAIAACHVDSASWYPSGKATVAAFYEYVSSGEKACVATIEVANTGKSTINSCTLSVSASTDARTYHQTIIREIVILPEKRVYLTVEITYVSETETLGESGLGIVDEYYL